MDAGIHQLVSEWVRLQPDRCAVEDPVAERSVSYAELWALSGRLAGYLADRGIGHGDVVGVALNRSIDLVVAFLGIVRAGAAYLPIDTKAPAGRRTDIVAAADAKLVFDALPAALGDRTCDVPVSGGDPCIVAFTSGSSGKPKGVVIPHSAVTWLTREPDYCVIEPGDRVANVTNPIFDLTTFEIWSTLTSGGTLVVFPSLTDVTLDRWVGLLRDTRLTSMVLTTSLFHIVARERPAAFETMRDLLVAGEQLDLHAARRVLAAGPPGRLVNCYGPTETTTFVSYFVCTAENLAEVDRVPIGFPFHHTGLFVVGEDMQPVAPGDLGELCIGGPGVATGYLGDPELTAAKFVPQIGAPDQRMYRSGDLARVLPDGALEVRGRIDRQIKLRGLRIEPGEIERLAIATELVDAAFVEKLGDGEAAALTGFVIPTGSTEDLGRQLAAALADRLPDYMIPARWIVLTELPLGATGKVDRAKLRALAEPADGDPPHAGPDDQAGSDPVREVWRELLRVDEVGPADNFIELGGNSLLAVQAAARLRERLAIDVEPADVLLAETAAELSVAIEGMIQGAGRG